MKTNAIAEISFWLHLPIFIFWVGTFFVSTTFWPDVVYYHFWFIALLYVSGYATGLIYWPVTKKVLFLCLLTLLTQRLRGYSWTAKKTWDHSFIG